MFKYFISILVIFRAKGWILIMYGIDIKLKLGDQLKNFREIQEIGGFINLNSFRILGVLRILASQNSFQSLHDKIFNIDRFAE